MRIFGFLLVALLGLANIVSHFLELYDVIRFGLITLLRLAIETPITPTSSGRWSP